MKRLNRWLLLILSGALFSPLALIANERAFDSGLAGFEVNLNKLSNPYRVFGYFLLPNATLTLDSSTSFTATYHLSLIHISEPTRPY